MHFSTFGDYLDSWGSATQKFSSSIAMTKNFHTKKKKKILKTNAPPSHTHTHTKKKKKKKKFNAPPKFHHNKKFSHIHTQLPNFSIAMQKNSYMSKIKIKKKKKKSPQVHAHAQINSHITKRITTKFSKHQHHIPNKNFP